MSVSFKNFVVFGVLVVLTLTDGHILFRRRSVHIRKTFQVDNATVQILFEQDEMAEFGTFVSYNEGNIPAVNLKTRPFSFQQGENSYLSITSLALRDCGSPEVKLNSFWLTPCMYDPCKLHPGQWLTLQVKFVPNVPATYLSCNIQLKKGEFFRNFDCGFSDMCNDPGIQCPLSVGHEYVLIVTKELSLNIAKGDWNIQLNIDDEQEAPFLCMVANVTVV